MTHRVIVEKLAIEGSKIIERKLPLLTDVDQSEQLS